jgi:protein ImuB
MLWIALHFPRLALEAPLRGLAPCDGVPWAIAEERAVIACDAAASALGVRAGMPLAAAWAIAPQLAVRPRDAPAERSALEGAAAWLGGFTPRVSLEPPASLLAEVSGGLRLFGGLAHLIERMRAGCRELGHDAVLAAAPTARSALWLAAAGCETQIEDRAALRPALAALPASVASPDSGTRELLRALGIATLGELLALPREGVALRCGQGLLDALDAALGAAPEPRAWFAAPPHFAVRLELPGEVTHAEGVLFAARRLLMQLEGVLAARQAGVRRFTLALVHRRARPSVLEIGLGSPAREAARCLALLRERLASFALPAPVEAIRLEAGRFVPLPGFSAGLFGDVRAEREDWVRLLERLRARLGAASIHGLGLAAEHRPERAWRPLAGDEAPPQSPEAWGGARPLWLLEPPRRLREANGVPQDGAPLELLVGPERIESGWWDGEDVARDYFIARAAGAALLWVYRARDGWYLHGIFA